MPVASHQMRLIIDQSNSQYIFVNFEERIVAIELKILQDLKHYYLNGEQFELEDISQIKKYDVLKVQMKEKYCTLIQSMKSFIQRFDVQQNALWIELRKLNWNVSENDAQISF